LDVLSFGVADVLTLTAVALLLVAVLADFEQDLPAVLDLQQVFLVPFELTVVAVAALEQDLPVEAVVAFEQDLPAVLDLQHVFFVLAVLTVVALTAFLEQADLDLEQVLVGVLAAAALAAA
jgi:hypothetical protein